MKFKGFHWDKGNSDKCEKHGLSREEIEQFFLQNEVYVAPDLEHSDLEDRFLAIGKSLDDRYIIVAFTFRGTKSQILLRPISARFMHEKELRKYEKEFGKNKNR